MEEYKTHIPMDNDTKIAITAIIAILVFLIAIVAAFFFDEVIDRGTERACVENAPESGDDYNDCDV